MPWGQSKDGETPLESREGLINDTITTRGQLFAAEAENVSFAVIKYLATKPRRRTAPFTFAWLLKLHQEMFGNVWQWAGTIRDRDLTIGVPVGSIAESLAALIADLAYWDQHWSDTLEQAVHLHHQAVKIHPFLNGNGRWSRLLAGVWLRMHDSPLPEWPVEIGQKTSSIRQEYLDCVRQADCGEYGPLYNLHKKYLA